MESSNRNTSDATSKRPSELTAAAIVLGIILSVMMGAANVYLGLRVGMTVSASIPAAVVAMGVFRFLLRRHSLLESNLVQTAASAGESLAAGIIFTMPAMILVGVWTNFHYWTTTFVALAGGILGVLFMIPMRRVFVVDNEELQYPEGLACAEVLRTGAVEGDANGTQQDSGAGLVIIGTVVGGLFKIFESLLGLLNRSVEWATEKAGGVFFVGADISPALIAVGYIVGLSIAVQIFVGGAIGWLVAIPILTLGKEIGEEPAIAARNIWSTQVRYIGVGTMIVGGIASIWRVRGGLISAVQEIAALTNVDSRDGKVPPTEKNIDSITILVVTILCVTAITGLYYILLDRSIGLTVITTVAMLVMSFFFAAVASYIVGLVGNSNSPVSGMTITAVLATGAFIYLFGFAGTSAIVATLGVAGIVCCVACTAGDVCNDLKTGHLVGASPRNQQIMQIIGVLVAAFVMAPVLTVLHVGSINRGTGGIGGEELNAPQAALFASLVDGFFGDGQLPKNMVAWGIGIGVLLLFIDWILQSYRSRFRLHVMPVAVGIYLPFGLSTPILLGGIVRRLADWRSGCFNLASARGGVLFASGIIAGESLIGVLLGIYFYLELKELAVGSALLGALSIPASQHAFVLQVVSFLALLGVGLSVYMVAAGKRR